MTEDTPSLKEKLEGSKKYLQNADLKGEDLEGANLQGAKNISCKQIKSAIINKITRLPEYINLTTPQELILDCNEIPKKN